jgi:hypothetical protein
MRQLRSYVTQTALYISIIMLIIIITVAIFLYWKLSGNNTSEALKLLTHNHSIPSVLYLLFIKTVFALTSGLIIRNTFKKIASPEIFFFCIAILAMSFTSLRCLFLIDGFLGYPTYFAESISRIVYFGKIITILCLFTSGLFSTGISFQKQQSFLLLILLISFIISSSLPIDLFKNDIILLKGTGSEYGMNIVFIILQVFAVLNFIVGFIKNNNHDYLFLAIAIAMISIGNEIFFSLIPGAISILALIIMISGTILFGYKIHKIYLWT